MNVVLTGFMGTGKSTVGRLLAERLEFEWVDTDDLIEARHGPIGQIFAGDGEEAFRDIERALATELSGRSRLVISTGGGMMLDEDSAALLGFQSRVFCLTAESEELLRRVSDQEGPRRPLLADGHPAQRIAELLAERKAGYAKYEQVSTDGRSLLEVVEDLLRRL
jgi:shikimate kinase